MLLNNYNEIASIYSKDNNDGTAYLAFKYIPELIKKHSNGNKTLDFGCGSGLSTRFLKDIGLSVEGVDINNTMLNEAKSLNDGIKYQLMQDDKLPYQSEDFHIIFSSFVLFEIESKDRLEKLFNEIYRSLKKDGIFIAVTGSEDMYRYPWLSLDVNFPENKNLQSGSIARVHLKEINLSVYDYFWTNEDYNDIFKKTKFSLIDTFYPLGDERDNYPWISELNVTPYVIYILKK